MAVALLLGHQFAVLSPTVSSAAHIRDLVMGAGLLDRYAGAVPLGIGVREFAANPTRTLEVAAEAGRRAMRQGADVILLGCLSLAFTGAGDDLQERLGVPVVNPLRVAVRTAEMLASGRRSQPPPPPRGIGDPGGSPSRRCHGGRQIDRHSQPIHEKVVSWPS